MGAGSGNIVLTIMERVLLSSRVGKDGVVVG